MAAGRPLGVNEEMKPARFFSGLSGISGRGLMTLLLGGAAVVTSASSPSCAAGTSKVSVGGSDSTSATTTAVATSGGGEDCVTTGSGGHSSTTTTGSAGGKASGSTTGGGMGGKGGAGGAGGIAGAGGAGGQGGSGGSAGAGGMGGAAGVGGQGGSGGGATAGVVVLLAGGGANVTAGEFHPPSSWTTTNLTDTTQAGAALTMTSPTTAVGVIASTMNASALDFTTWTPGNWNAFTGVAAGVLGQGRSSLATTMTTADMVTWGTNGFDYFASYAAGAWNPTAEPVEPPVDAGLGQSFGGSPPSLVTLNGDVVIAYAGSNGDLYDQTRAAGAWQPAYAHGGHASHHRADRERRPDDRVQPALELAALLDDAK
jgi:hypothetical protein